MKPWNDSRHVPPRAASAGFAVKCPASHQLPSKPQFVLVSSKMGIKIVPTFLSLLGRSCI